MEAKLATLKSPGLKSGLPASPTARNFNPGNRQSLVLDNSSNFLSPDSAAHPTPSGNDAATTLAQQRAKLKASNASHRISAPVLNTSGTDGRASWGPSHLSQVSEQQAPAQEVIIPSSRPKSSDFSGSIASPRPGGEQSDSWANMVSTPLIPMFKDTRTTTQTIETPPKTDQHWSRNPPPAVPRMGDPTTRRRPNKLNEGGGNNNAGVVYDDNGNPIPGSQRNVSGPGGPGGWNGARSPALSNASSNRFGGNDDNNSQHGGSQNPGGMGPGGMNGLGMQMGGPFGVGMGSPTLGMGMGVPPLSPFNMNLGVGGMFGMGMTPEQQAQLLAAQMAATSLGGPWLGMQPMSAGLNSATRRGPGGGGRSPGLKSASSVGSRADTPKEEDVDPALLNDIPAWLRSLRLHKYTPNFENTTWQEMVQMDEAALEAKGVAALGARRKMLKTFENVRKKMGIEGPPPSAPPSAAV